MRIALNEFRRLWDEVGEDTVAAVRRVGASGWYILGKEVEAFEAELAEMWPTGHVVGTGNGLDALEIALRCVGVRVGSRVLTTPLSAFATTLAILRTGAIPVFVDADENGLIDLDACRRRLASSPRIDALLPVHLYGLPVDLERLEQLAHELDVPVVEDCAQSILAEWNGRRTGSASAAAATSFYPTKNLGALGDGGAMITASAELATRGKALRHYGQTAPGSHDDLGLNSRLDEIHAAALRSAMLPRLAAWTRRRREIATKYLEQISHPHVRTTQVDRLANPCWHLFPVLVPEGSRESFRRHLAACGVETGVHYPKLITEQAAISSSAFEVAEQPARALRITRREVSLPINPFLSNEEVEAVARACNTWAG